MVVFIAGASHTGKTALAQRLLERYQYPYLSIDHLKMGLIRSGQTPLTPEDDGALTDYLWPIVREMAKTAIENRQDLVIEGCYIPFDWKSGFEEAYLPDLQYICLIMTENYIQNHFGDIQKFASTIEDRGDDPDLAMGWLLQDNAKSLEMCQKYDCPYILIDDSYNVESAIEEKIRLQPRRGRG